MSDYAPITERLRGSFRSLPFISEREDWVGIPRTVLEQECDTIDSAYSALEVVAVALDGRGGLPLPLDGDGEVICVGDRMRCPDGTTFTVDSIDYGLHPPLGNDLMWVVWGENAEVYELATDCIHSKEQSVEDVLREFAVAVSGQNGGFGELVVAEYAKKLRLAGDA